MVQNKGSAQDIIKVSAKSEKGWKVTIYKDENKNGLLDKDETTVISQTDPLASGGSSSSSLWWRFLQMHLWRRRMS